MRIIPHSTIEDNDSDAAYPLVLDTKYKRQDQNSDYYQIIAYALAIPSARNCCLLYPKDTICEDNLIVSLTYGKSFSRLLLSRLSKLSAATSCSPGRHGYKYQGLSEYLLKA